MSYWQSIYLALLVVSVAGNQASARVDVECHAGAPYGIARITLNRGDLRGNLDENALLIQERDGRIHYPSFRVGRLGPILSNLVGGNGAPDNLTVTFLFDGETPLHVTLYTPEVIELELVPATRRDTKEKKG